VVAVAVGVVAFLGWVWVKVAGRLDTPSQDRFESERLEGLDKSAPVDDLVAVRMELLRRTP
jgi:hypothetical protein